MLQENNILDVNQSISVWQLNTLVKSMLETQLINIWVKGEISNLTKAASGHYYFNLKDNKAQVRCALFKGYASKLITPLNEGDEIELTGNITLYEARGEFQIVVTDVKSVGSGQLYAQYEALKKKLEQEGLFAQSRKQTLPTFPKKVGIVTSLAAAALRDVVTTLKRRMNLIDIIVYPTVVQGKGSEQQIAQAIACADSRQEVDVLIVCRGGGSIEDLWSFNEEVTVRAIAHCSLPVISSVGHETDFTLSDFVADVRAPTPTAAAEIVSPDKSELLKNLHKIAQSLDNKLLQKYYDGSQKLDSLSKRLLHPQDTLNKRRVYVSELEKQLIFAFRHTIDHKIHQLKQLNQEINYLKPNINQLKQQIESCDIKLNAFRQQFLPVKKQKLASLIGVLDAVSPQKILERGYSVVTDRRGKIITNAETLKLGQQINIAFAIGSKSAVIAQPSKQADLFD